MEKIPRHRVAKSLHATRVADERYALGWLAERAATAARRELARPDLVTWAPTTQAHRRLRGFDHAALLARSVARDLGVPCRALLVRDFELLPETVKP